MLLTPSVLAAGFAIAGYTSHKLYWVRHEFDEQVPRIIFGVNSTWLLITYSLSREYSLLKAVCFAATLIGIYGLALFGTISVYRLYRHPLKHFEGPKWARLSAWWKVKHIAKAGAHYSLTNQLHERYGEVVRTGPNNLSINHVEALQAIYGSHSPCTKPPSYLIGGLVSVQSERNPHKHKLRRAVWDKALGSNASNAFFPRLTQMAELLAHRLAERNGEQVSVNDWMHFITFDVMAQFCFSRDWNQLATGKIHQGIKYASDYLQFAVYGTQVPWLAISLMKIPFMPEPQSAMMEFSTKALDERMQQEPEIPDAMSYILSEKDPEAQQFLSRHDLESDVFMIMLAGADTSFSVLVNLCFRLAAQPEYQTRLREETAAAFNTDGQGRSVVNWPLLSGANFLAAIINETLRLHPPVPSGMPRVVPREGLTIPLDNASDMLDDSNSIQIPGNAVVSVPTYRIQRDPRYWVDPHSFVPERWTTKPEMILDRRAFCPFSLGAYGCAGKYFALMEIKLVIARLVLDFDIKFADNVTSEEMGRTGAKRRFLTTQQDWMTLQPGPLRLKFEKRK
ncbi:hypothetical protein OHC33_008383 [Knufia fluminis]|uniref:Cytochrome P450 n=1 Tax=Knufia fluminis TaxID=191047 RepID=A0AAN8EBW3_9EURO|nr:hypothetical protein OHC33_008383 [Knufia fluminis]